MTGLPPPSAMNDPTASLDPPLQDFTDCHAGIARRLDQLGELPALLAPAARAVEIAEAALGFFQGAILEHHQDEEKALFPLVREHAAPGAERDHVELMIERLVREHRELEKAWARLEPGLRKLAKGRPTEISVVDIDFLVHHYRGHAQYEETEFLPLAQTILGRQSEEMAALGRRMHKRHAPWGLFGRG